MNLTKKTILTLGLLAVAGVSYAQNETSSVPATPVGLLGQAYSEARLGLTDIKDYSKHQYEAGVSANVPITPYLDVGAGYDYGRIRSVGHFNGVSTTATAFTTVGGVKPFVGAGVGYQWVSGRYQDDDFAVWAAAVGVEIPAGVVSITPRIVYTDDFRNTTESEQQFSYEVETNYWLNRRSAVFATVGFNDPRGSSQESWNYTVGARFKF